MKLIAILGWIYFVEFWPPLRVSFPMFGVGEIFKGRRGELSIVVNDSGKFLF